MGNIAIYIYDYSLLGGCQKVTANLAKLFHQHKMPVKAVISYEVKGNMDYSYPTDIELINGKRNFKFIKDWLVSHNISNLIVQVENLLLCSKLIGILNGSSINVFPVLHSTPYYWLRKYYSFKQYMEKPILIAQYLKMKFYWHNLHMSIFKRLAEQRIICVSKQARKELCGILGNEYADNILYIYNPINVNSQECDVEKRNIITYAGRLSVEKRTGLMLEVWKKVIEKESGWIFRILGDGPDKIGMEKFCRKNDIKNVVFTGKVNNVVSYLNESKISVLFSKYEGLPTGMLEACACGNALVGCINDGGLTDIVENGVNGYTAKADAGHLAELILKIIKNEKLCYAMGKNSRRLVSKFSDDQILRSWKSMLE